MGNCIAPPIPVNFTPPPPKPKPKPRRKKVVLKAPPTQVRLVKPEVDGIDEEPVVARTVPREQPDPPGCKDYAEV